MFNQPIFYWGALKTDLFVQTCERFVLFMFNYYTALIEWSVNG